MNITISSYRALVKQVSRLADATERLTLAAESCALEYSNYQPRPRTKLSAEERQAEVSYTDETEDLVRELRDKLGKRPPDGTEDEVL